MPGTDVHTHLAPQLDTNLVDSLPDVVLERSGRLVVDGHLVGPPALYDTGELAGHLRATGLDRALVSVPPPLYRQHLARDDARSWVAALNDGLIERLEGQPSLDALAYLPLEHPDLAVEEYLRISRDARYLGVTASAGGTSTILSDPGLEPLWAAMNSDSAMVLLHPGPTPDDRLSAFYLSNLLGNPSETSVAAAHLVFSGVLTRHAAMRVVLVHCGGTVPAVVGRWQRGVDTDRPGTAGLMETPRQAIRRFYVDCLAHDPDVVDLAISVFGEDRMLLGSDWPFPMGTSDPIRLVEHRGAAFIHKVAISNPNAVLGPSGNTTRYARSTPRTPSRQ